MNLYERFVLPYLIDGACGMAAIQRLRDLLLAEARGRVLEIGIGTGRNLPFYRKAQIESLCGLDPSPQMHGLARRRARAHALEVEMLCLSAEAIPADDASYDTVVCTFSLCTIPDPRAALSEMRRVLRPQGRLLFCEHGCAPDHGVRRWQERLNPWWKPLAGGCHLNRDAPALVREAGFQIEALQQAYLPGPRAMTYVSTGVAIPL